MITSMKNCPFTGLSNEFVATLSHKEKEGVLGAAIFIKKTTEEYYDNIIKEKDQIIRELQEENKLLKDSKETNDRT